MTSEASTVAAPPPDAAGGPRWTPLTVFIGVLAVLGITFVAAVAVSIVNPDLDEETFGLIIQAIFAAALFIVPLALVRWPGRFLAPPSVLGMRRFRLASGIGWLFAAYGVFFVFLVIYGIVVQPDPQEIIDEIEQEKETIKIVVLGLLVVIAAPLSEELFFRGFLFGGLRAKMVFWPAALISGIIFGAIHAPSGLLQVPPLAIFGVLLAWLYEKTGSIWPPIMMHLIQNAISFLYTISS